MDKDFPESLLDVEAAQEDLDRQQLRDHEDQNPDGQNPTRVPGECSDLHQNQTRQLDLDRGEENHVCGAVWRLVKAL